jgi:hypothetical protein
MPWVVIVLNTEREFVAGGPNDWSRAVAARPFASRPGRSAMHHVGKPPESASPSSSTYLVEIAKI